MAVLIFYRKYRINERIYKLYCSMEPKGKVESKNGDDFYSDFLAHLANLVITPNSHLYLMILYHFPLFRFKKR